MSPGLIGRDAEMNRLVSFLDSVKSGKGNTVIISGENGVGKSRLINEVADKAVASGFKVLTGSCMPGISSAFMPIVDVLKSGELDNLAAESSPKVICAYLTNNAGILMSKYEREESTLDAEIFSSMLTAVNSFVQDSLSMLKIRGKDKSMNRLGYGDYTILIESSGAIHLAVIIDGKENEFLIQDLREILADVQTKFGNIIDNWKGDLSEVEGTQDVIGRLITSGKYEGTTFGGEDPKLKQNLIMDNISRGLVRVSDDTPILIVIDNLHWIDSLSLGFLHYLARNIRSSRIFIIGAYRPEEILETGGKSEHSLTETLRLMSRDDLFVKMELKRLTLPDISRLTGEILGNASLPQQFADDVFKISEGNPLFVQESLRLLTDEKTLELKDGVWEVRGQGPLKIPSKIFDIIMRRISFLPTDLHEIIDCASVVGLEFTTNYLEQLIKIDKIQLLKSLRDIESKYRLIRSQSTGYAFDHIMIRDIVYHELPGELCREYHRILAEYIETANSGKLAQFVPLLAHHYSAAHEISKAVQYLKTAAENAKNSYANKEAIQLYNTMIGFMDEGKITDGKIDALESLAEVQSIIGEYESAVKSYDKLITILPRDSDLISKFHRKMAIALFKKGDYTAANEMLEKAMVSAKSAKNDLEQGRVHLEMSWVNGQRREYDVALDHSIQAALILERYPDAKRDLAQLYNSLYIMYYYKGDAQNVQKYSQKSLEIREELGDRPGIAASYNAIGTAWRMRGNLTEAMKCYEKSLAIYEKIGDLYSLAGAYFNINDILSKIGDKMMAIEGYLKSLHIYERLGESYSAADTCNNIGNVYITLGKYEQALDWMGKNLIIREKLNDEDGIARAYMNIGEIFIIQEQIQNAIKYFKRSVEIATSIKNDMYLAYDYNYLAECYMGLHNYSLVISYAGQSLDISHDKDYNMLLGSNNRILGSANAAVGNDTDAKRYFDKSIELSADNEIELGKNMFEYSKFLFDMQDYEKGNEYLNKAIQIFTAHKLTKELEKANNLASAQKKEIIS